MAKHVIYSTLGFLAVVALALAIYIEKPTSGGSAVADTLEGAGSLGQSASITTAEDGIKRYEVAKVIDGDTITVTVGEKTETVRLIGVNAAETATTNECFAAEASNELKKLLNGKRVALEKDATQGERDKYDRLLAYVFTSDGLNVNEYLITEGFVREYTYNKSYKYQTEFKAAQTSAQNNKKGLWAPGVCEKPAANQTVIEKSSPPPSAPVPMQQTESPPPPAPTEQTSPPPPAQAAPPPAQQSTPPPAPSSAYTCSSNTYNCSDFKTQAEAQAVFDMCGGTGNDVHRLDSNKDGEACESLP